MKIYSLFLFKLDNEDQEPIVLGSSFNLALFGFFNRKANCDLITVLSKRCVKKYNIPGRTRVEHLKYVIFNQVLIDRLVCFLVTDEDYPLRVAFNYISETLKSNSVDVIGRVMKEYNNRVDKDRILKLGKEIEEVNTQLHLTFNDLIDRGESLNRLIM